MRFLLAIVFVTMLFVAGCPGGGPQEGAAQGGTPSGGAASAQEQAQEQTQEEGGQAAQEQAQEQSLFGDWDVGAMMAEGQPVHCTVTYSAGGQTSTSEVWIKGQNMRSEATTSMFPGVQEWAWALERTAIG